MEMTRFRTLHSRRLTRAVVLPGLVASLLLGHFTVSQAARKPSALSFLVLGDWGRDGQYRQREVAREMANMAGESRASFVIATGDNFYPEGITSVDSPRWRTSFEDIYQAPSLQIPWYVVLGNHDYRGQAAAELAYGRHSSRWKMPARYYRQTMALPKGGKADFFFLDTSPFLEGYRKDRAYGDITQQSAADQLRWLEAGLVSSRADWKIVIGHHPVYSEGASHGDTRELVRDLKPILERHGVQLYLNGHDHDLQHIVVNGISYVTSGAGSLARPTGTGPDTRFGLGGTAGFVVVSMTSERLTARFIDWNGKERYEFTQPRLGGPAPPAPVRPDSTIAPAQ